jgi:cell division topological specificity factor
VSEMLIRVMRIFRRNEPSGHTARKRLQLVLVQDRIGLPQSVLEAMRNDLLGLFSKYLVIDQESVTVEIKSSGESMILVSNITVKDVVRTPVLS